MATILNGHKADNQKINRIHESAKGLAFINGHLIRRKEAPESSEIVIHAPFTLFPTVIPRSLMENVKSLQTAFNILMYKVGNDHEFLQNCFQSVIHVDEFSRKLWELYMTVRRDGTAQEISLTILRNDFMMIETESCGSNEYSRTQNLELRQIENNTMASGAAGLGTVVTNIHKYTLKRAGVPYSNSEMPENNPNRQMSRGLIKAWELYGKSSAVILFFVDFSETNVIDQCFLEKSCFDIDSSITVVYKTFDDVIRSGTLGDTNELLVDGEEVAVVYFRHGYSPRHYKSEKEWGARLLIERSKAIKCPTIHHHLAGSKKIQQVLACPGAVERFIKDEKLATKLRSYFVCQYSMDKGSDGDSAIDMAIQSPEKFVMKPQREGGGNNLYDQELRQKLISIKNTDVRSAFILMERIYPCKQTNYLVRDSTDIRLDTINSEIGIFGVIIGEKDYLHLNIEAGHIVRSKREGSNEGGLMTGSGYLDSAFLIG